MKNKLILKLFNGVVLTLVVGLADAESLHGSLGVSAASTDVYRVMCSANANGDTVSLKVSLVDLAPKATPMLSAQVLKAQLAKNTTDAIDGDKLASPAVLISGGNGGYDLRVNKTAAGAELYSLNYSCLSKSGKNTAISLTTLQNQ
ncbi:MAG: hypothetical protein K9L60_02575 [Methylovulum sp.]|jgi:hypothetical protein|nr:hypothetical protein [Methylovulum sp.]MCF7998064.1 hypothetical protein [Methylovulum sp.]